MIITMIVCVSLGLLVGSLVGFLVVWSQKKSDNGLSNRKRAENIKEI